MKAGLRTLLGDRRARYLLVGAWNTLFGYMAFVALYFLLTPFRVHYLAVLVITQFFSVTNAYFSYKTLVFRTKANIVAEYFRFCIVYAGTFLLNIVLITLLVEVLGVNAVLAQSGITVILVGLTYVGHGRFSFKHTGHGPNAASGAISPTAARLRENIFITGASRGIGAALADYYAADGVTLGLLARSTGELEAVAKACIARGASVYIYTADVGDGPRVKEFCDEFAAQVGRVDLVIANAGILIEEDDEVQETWVTESTMRTNFLGTVNTFSPFVPLLKKQGSGCLATISSIGAIRATHNSGAYSASKAAVNLWTESLRLKLRPYGVNVSTICCGFVETAMTSSMSFWMPGLLTPEGAARIIARAIDARARTIIVPWQSKLIWTFFSMLPGKAYDALISWAKSRQRPRGKIRPGENHEVR